MFYGQIMMQNYLSDPAISFCAIGDVAYDKAPLQITDFGQGLQLDQTLSKIFLEGGGGNNLYESYELAAYFYANHCEMPKGELPYFFITGDEHFYENITQFALSKVFNIHTDKHEHMKKIPSLEIWSLLKTKFNVFHLHKPFKKKNEDPNIIKEWEEVLGCERILKMHTPKACIDVMLGAIALTSGTRTLEEYIKDMKTREQTEERISEVVEALKLVTPSYIKDNTIKCIITEKNMKIIEEEEKKKEEIKEEEEVEKLEFDQIYDMDYVRKIVQEQMPEVNYDKKTLVLVREREKVEKKFGIHDQIPKHLICPISQRMFISPVRADDGNTYEEKYIETWLKFKSTSPLTGMKIKPNLMHNEKRFKDMDSWKKMNQDWKLID